MTTAIWPNAVPALLPPQDPNEPSTSAPRYYVPIPRCLLEDIRTVPATIGVYALVGRLYRSTGEPVPLSPADVHTYDPAISTASALRALKRLTGEGYLIATLCPGRKTLYAPTWGKIRGAPRPWNLDAPSLGRPDRCELVRLEQRLLDTCMGRLRPHHTHPAQAERYLSTPLLALADIGTYALAMIGLPARSTTLTHLGLLAHGRPIPLPDDTTILALTAYESTSQPGQSTPRGRDILLSASYSATPRTAEESNSPASLGVPADQIGQGIGGVIGDPCGGVIGDPCGGVIGDPCGGVIGDPCGDPITPQTPNESPFSPLQCHLSPSNAPSECGHVADVADVADVTDSTPLPSMANTTSGGGGKFSFPWRKTNQPRLEARHVAPVSLAIPTAEPHASHTDFSLDTGSALIGEASNGTTTRSSCAANQSPVPASHTEVTTRISGNSTPIQQNQPQLLMGDTIQTDASESARALRGIGVRRDTARTLASHPLAQVERVIAQARARGSVRDLAAWVVSALRALPTEGEIEELAASEQPVSPMVIYLHPALTDEARYYWVRRYHAALTPSEKRAVLARLDQEHPQ